MDRPIARIFAVLLWTIWFDVVAPLHLPGILILGDASSRSILPPCCAHRQTPPDSKDTHNNPPAKPCAICAMLSVAGTTAPPEPLILAPLKTQQIVNHAVPSMIGWIGTLNLHCRGPPAA